ncbi:MAG: 50S ribosomal protein L14e [Thermoproteota archaeon]
MPTFTIGRICVKKKGRERGLKCVVVDEIDDNYVLVTGPKKISGVRRRRVNIDHLSPTDKSIRIRRGASDQDVTSALTRANLTTFMSGKPISSEGSGAEA